MGGVDTPAAKALKAALAKQVGEGAVGDDVILRMSPPQEMPGSGPVDGKVDVTFQIFAHIKVADFQKSIMMQVAMSRFLSSPPEALQILREFSPAQGKGGAPLGQLTSVERIQHTIIVPPK